jgi:hypothetical protein
MQVRYSAAVNPFHLALVETFSRLHVIQDVVVVIVIVSVAV